MTTLNQAPNAFHATHLEGVDKELQYMNSNLEEIQKSHISIWPFWKNTLPERAYSISIKVSDE